MSLFFSGKKGPMRARKKRLLFLSFAALLPSAAIALPHQTSSSTSPEVHKVGIDARQFHNALSGRPETTRTNEPDFFAKSGSERALKSLMIRGNTHTAPSTVFIERGQVLAYSNRKVRDGIEPRIKFIFDEDFGGNEQMMKEQMTAEAMLTLQHLHDYPVRKFRKEDSGTLGAKALEIQYQVGWAVSRESHDYNKDATRLIGAIEFSAMLRPYAIWLLDWYKTRGDVVGGVPAESVVLTSDEGSEGTQVIRILKSYPLALKQPRDCIDAFTAGSGALNDKNDLGSGEPSTRQVYIDKIEPDQVIGFYSADLEPKKTKIRFVFPDSFNGNSVLMSEQMYAEAVKALEKLQERINRSGDAEGDKVLKIPYDAAWALKSGDFPEDRGSVLFRGMTMRQAEWLLTWFRDRTPIQEDMLTSDGLYIVTRNFAGYPSTTTKSRVIIDAFSAGAGSNYDADSFAFVNRNPLYTHEDNDENGPIEYDQNQYDQNQYGPIDDGQHEDIAYVQGGYGEVDEVMDDVFNTQSDTGPAVVGVWSIAKRAKFIFPHTFDSDERRMRVQMIAEYAFATRYLVQVSGVTTNPLPFNIGWTHINFNGVLTPAGSLEFGEIELQWAQNLQYWYMSRPESTELLVVPPDVLQRFDIVSDMPEYSHVIGYPATRDVEVTHELPVTITLSGNTVKRDDSHLTDSKPNLAVHTVDQARTERSA